MMYTPMTPPTEWARAQAENQVLETQAERESQLLAGETRNVLRSLARLLPKRQPVTAQDETCPCPGEFVAIPNPR